MDSHAAPLRNPSRDHNRFNSMAERSSGSDRIPTSEAAPPAGGLVFASTLLGQRMLGRHHFAQAIARHVGVDLGGRDVGVAQQRLDNA